MSSPQRLQRSRQHKQVSPNGLPIQYIGRPGKWGNPFKVLFEDDSFVVKDEAGNYSADIYETREEAVKKAIQCFSGWIDGKISIKELDITELAGKNLSCWCKEGTPCHGDVLLKLANMGA